MVAQAYVYGGMAALQLAGGYFASQNIKATAALNKDIADMNAEFAELDAFDAIAEGQTNQARYQSVIDGVLGDQQLAYTAADIDVNYGTAAAKQEETRFVGDMNLMEIEKQAQEKALGYKTQARAFKTAGVNAIGEGNAKAASTMFNSVMGAAKTGLTGYEKYGSNPLSEEGDSGWANSKGQSLNSNPFR